MCSLPWVLNQEAVLPLAQALLQLVLLAAALHYWLAAVEMLRLEAVGML